MAMTWPVLSLVFWRGSPPSAMLSGSWSFPVHLECYPTESGSKYWLCACFCVFSTEKEGGVCTVRGLTGGARRRPCLHVTLISSARSCERLSI